MSVIITFGRAPRVARVAEVVDLGTATEAAAALGELAFIANGEAEPIVAAFGAEPDAHTPGRTDDTTASIGIPAGCVHAVRLKAGDRVAVAALPDVPGSIADLVATAIDHESVGLAFTPASDATFHQYAVSLFEADEWSDPATLVDGTVSGLEPETQYDFRVRGVNGFRFGPWSNVDDATTEAESP